MAECVCKEYIVWEGDLNEEAVVECKDCGQSPAPKDIIRALNATERLLTAAKKLRARTYQSPTDESAMDWLGVRRDAFMELLDAIAYAEILDGKDD